jgi:hypothetical protein
MANTSIIQLKRSNTAFSMPAANTLAPGELAVNLTDGRLFLQLQNGEVIDISSTPVGNTYYVAVTGNDEYDGKTPGAAKATIRAAVAAAQPVTQFIFIVVHTQKLLLLLFHNKFKFLVQEKEILLFNQLIQHKTFFG